MAMLSWKVAIIDTGVDPHLGLSLRSTRGFVDDSGRVVEHEMAGDTMGHGTAVASIIASAQRSVELLSAKVVNAHGRATAAALAAAIRWSMAQSADLIHLSMGLRHDRSVLAEAVGEAVAAQVLLVAATPAQGAPTYPASYPRVMRATGDARCAQGQVAWLDTAQAQFGACPKYVSAGGREFRGASVGAAYLSRFIVDHCSPAPGAAGIHRQLIELAAHRGAERRQA